MSIGEIFATKGTNLAGKRILIGVTGSIAAIEVPHLLREILRYAGDPIVVMSEEASRFVAVDALTWSMGKKPITEISGISEHIKWVSDDNYKVDIYIICPATANTISKIANGIADTPVTLAALAAIGANIPVLIVPIAHTVLLENQITKRNINYLKQNNVYFTAIAEEENKYKFPPLDIIMNLIFEIIDLPQLLKGKKILITGGATREYLDDVRFLSNPSTGYSALQIVKVLSNYGADILFILGEGNMIDIKTLNVPVKVVRSTQDMLELVQKEISSGYDAFISVAAVSDYSPSYHSGKIPSLQENLIIDLNPTPKILKSIREKYPDLFIVGYKAEVGLDQDSLIKRGEEFLHKNNIQIVCANWVGVSDKGFVARTNEVFVIRQNNKIIHLKGSKEELGRDISLIIIEELNKWSKK